MRASCDAATILEAYLRALADRCTMARRGPKERSAGGATPLDPSSAAPPGEDVRALREAVRDVTPHGHVPRIRPGTAPVKHGRPARAGAHPARAPRPAEPAAHAAAPIEEVHEPLDGSEVISFRRAGVRDQVMRKLRRGLYPVDEALDLHGLSQAAARDLLERFIDEQRAAGHRCVRIVHGKGYRSGARGPVLKMLVNGWLKRRSEVIAFHSARALDGGTGAVYVLLRA